MSVQLTSNRILVQLDEVENKTPSGIIIPGAEEAELTQTGVVRDVGPGRVTKSKNVVPVSLKPGERIMFEKTIGDNVTLEEGSFVIMSEDDVLGVID